MKTTQSLFETILLCYSFILEITYT